VFVMQPLQSRAAKVKRDQALLIPSTLHQTWFEKRISRLWYPKLEKFWELNGDLNVAIYDDADCDDFMAEYFENHPILDIFRRAKFGPMRADIFRYCVLHARGGFYCDISKTISRPLSQFVDRDSAGLVSFEGNQFFFPPSNAERERIKLPQNYLCNWALGFAERHPFIAFVIDKIVELRPQFDGVCFPNPKASIVTYTGPGLLTHCFHEYMRTNHDYSIMQAPVDFDGAGSYNPVMSRVRYLRRASYKHAVNSPILE